MVFNQYLAALVIFLSPFLVQANTRFGPSGSGGGGPQAADFTSSARLIEAALLKAPRQADEIFQVEGLVSLYKEAIDTTEVICATGLTLESMQQYKQKAYYDGANTIHLYCEKYDELKRAGKDKYVVVFHEYMRKLGLETSGYQLSSRLPLLFVAAKKNQRAIDAFCEGGSKDKFQLETYLSQMIAEGSLDPTGAKMLREASVNNIKFPDASAREIATFLGWTKDNQYSWAVNLICNEKDFHQNSADFSDTSRNDQSIVELNGLSGAFLRIGKSFTILKGRAVATLQNGRSIRKPDEYQPYCKFAHDTDSKRDTKISTQDVRSGNIISFRADSNQNSPAGYHINFSIEDNENVTDISVWLPGEIGSVERLRSVLKKSCGNSYVNLADLVPTP